MWSAAVSLEAQGARRHKTNASWHMSSPQSPDVSDLLLGSALSITGGSFGSLNKQPSGISKV